MDHPFAHFGWNFLKTLEKDLETQSLLLCLDDDGKLLFRVVLVSPSVSSCPPDIREGVKFAKSIGATNLVRVQRQPANHTNPFHIHSQVTRALYSAVQFHELPLVEVVIIKGEPQSLPLIKAPESYDLTTSTFPREAVGSYHKILTPERL
jgi:DNA repair protein RadC